MKPDRLLDNSAAAKIHRVRERQHSFYAEESDATFEISRPHGCGRLYEFLIEHKFRTGLRVLNFEVAARSILELCCGSGMMAEKFARAGAAVTGIDLSAAAVARARERARRYGFAAQFLVADAESLAFGDGSFDIAAVHDGLHHLEDPERAVQEMARVARHGVLILDPARAALTRLAVRVGIAVDVEEAGNEVKRLVPRRIAEILQAQGFRRVRWERTLMYYPHRPPAFFRRFDHFLLFAPFAVSFAIVNLIVGRWGNKLALCATR